MNPEAAARAAEAALAVGAIGLDQVAVGQLLLSQPLVGGAIVGFACGDLQAGVLAGAFFQFLCLTDLPVGASVPPDTVLAGLTCATAFVLLRHAGGWSDEALLGLFALGFLPCAYLARSLDLAARRANRVWVGLTERLIGAGRLRFAQCAALGGIAFFFARGALLAALTLFGAVAWGGAGLERAAAAAPVLELVARAVPLFGLSALVAQRRRSGWTGALTGGLGAGAVAGWVLG